MIVVKYAKNVVRQPTDFFETKFQKRNTIFNISLNEIFRKVEKEKNKDEGISNFLSENGTQMSDYYKRVLFLRIISKIF
jgi:hypothetical protein